MSIDSSLKSKSALSRHRNVLKRAERIEALKEQDRWNDGDTVFGLPKVAHRKSHAGKKKAEAEKQDVGATDQAPQTGESESKEQAKPK